MCANVLIWGDSEQSAVGKNHCFLNGPSYAIALATYAHFNTRLTGRQCRGLCCARQRRDSHGGNFCLTGDILSGGVQGAGGRATAGARAAPAARLGRKVTCTWAKWKPLRWFLHWEGENLGNPCMREGGVRERKRQRKGGRREELTKTCWTRYLAGIKSVYDYGALANRALTRLTPVSNVVTCFMLSPVLGGEFLSAPLERLNDIFLPPWLFYCTLRKICPRKDRQLISSIDRAIGRRTSWRLKLQETRCQETWSWLWCLFWTLMCPEDCSARQSVPNVPLFLGVP